MNDGAALGLVLDQVSKDKNIDRAVLVETLEQAILTAAKRAFGMHREMEAKFNEESGRVDLFQIIVIVGSGHAGQRRARRGADPGGTDRAGQPGVDRRQRGVAGGGGALQPEGRGWRRAAVSDLLRREGSGEGRGAGREVRRAPQAEPRLEGLRPHRRADREAGHPAARPRGRARERLQPVQGPQGRADLRHRPPVRARQHHRRSRRRRGGAAGARPGAARVVSRRRPHRRVRRRHRQDRARPADHPVAHAQGPAREAVRDGGPRDLREDRAHRGVGPRGGCALEDRGQLARSRRRSGRRVRRHEGLARAGGRAGAARREDRHRSVRSAIRRASCATRSRPPRSRA